LKNNELSQGIQRRIKKLLDKRIIPSLYSQKTGEIEESIPIYDSRQKIVSWFVPYTIKNKLVSFLQFDENLEFIRHSTFLNKNSDIEDCPERDTWLEPKNIIELAKTKTDVDDVFEKPFLTYDQNISRIVWCVKAKNKKGNTKTIFVVGNFVYLPIN